MNAWLALGLGMVIGTGMLALGVWLGATWWRSASRDEDTAAAWKLEAAQTQLSAAKSVSDMTVTLADMSIRESQSSERMELLRIQLVNLTEVVTALQSQLARNTDNLAMMLDSFIQRGYLREARTPEQVGERAKPGPLSPDRVPKAREDGSPSPTVPTATG